MGFELFLVRKNRTASAISPSQRPSRLAQERPIFDQMAARSGRNSRQFAANALSDQIHLPWSYTKTNQFLTLIAPYILILII